MDQVLIVDGSNTYAGFERTLLRQIASAIGVPAALLVEPRGRGRFVSFDEVDAYGGRPSAPIDQPGWSTRCIDPATGCFEASRLGRRAARRQRARARAARRLACRDGNVMGPSTDHPHRG